MWMGQVGREAMGMNNYTPLFGQIVDSSLWEESLAVRILFVTMLAVQDWDHVVRVPDHHLKRKANITDEELLGGLSVLSSPDTKSSIPQPFEGRRIQRVNDGWLLLNGEKYQEMMRESNQRAKWARQKREQRMREKIVKGAVPLPGEAIEVAKFGDGKPSQCD